MSEKSENDVKMKRIESLAQWLLHSGRAECASSALREAERLRAAECATLRTLAGQVPLRIGTVLDAMACARLQMANKHVYFDVAEDGAYRDLFEERVVRRFGQRLLSDDELFVVATVQYKDSAGVAVDEVVGYARVHRHRDGAVLAGSDSAVLSADADATGRKFDCELMHLYVLPELHSCGLGTRLFRRAVREAQQQWSVSAMLVWAVSSEATQRFYERLGATIVANRREKDGANVPAYAFDLSVF